MPLVWDVGQMAHSVTGKGNVGFRACPRGNFLLRVCRGASSQGFQRRVL